MATLLCGYIPDLAADIARPLRAAGHDRDVIARLAGDTGDLDSIDKYSTGGGEMTHSAKTRLTVKEAMRRAVEYFGPQGRCRLNVTERGDYRIVFAGDGGYVIVSAHRAPRGSHLELEVWGFDKEAEEFLEGVRE